MPFTVTTAMPVLGPVTQKTGQAGNMSIKLGSALGTQYNWQVSMIKTLCASFSHCEGKGTTHAPSTTPSACSKNWRPLLPIA